MIHDIEGQHAIVAELARRPRGDGIFDIGGCGRTIHIGPARVRRQVLDAFICIALIQEKPAYGIRDVVNVRLDRIAGA